ncbi:MAG: ABC transporter permease [Bacilli bacterium]|nr:ABC transporter permease [Bacilli bacterium]
MKQFFTNIGQKFKFAFTKEGAKANGKRIINYPGFGLGCTIVIILVLLAFFDKNAENPFFSWNGFTLTLGDNAIYALLATGIMCVLLTGGMDISVGSTLAVTACTTSLLAVNNPSVPVVIWIFVAIVIGAACGFVNGFLIGKLKVVPLIATLGTMFAYRGLAYVITGGDWIKPTDFEKVPEFAKLSNSTLLGIYSVSWIAFFLLIVMGLFLVYTRPGRRLYAVGTNEESVIVAGNNPANIKIMAYTICGALAGLAGVLYASKLQQVNSEVGMNYEMTAIAICVIGGVSNTGGKGRADCLLLGILFMTFLTRLLNVIEGFAVWEELFKGVIILIAVGINITNDAIKARREVLALGRRL